MEPFTEQDDAPLPPTPGFQRELDAAAPPYTLSDAIRDGAFLSIEPVNCALAAAISALRMRRFIS